MAGQLPAALRPTFPSEKEDESKSLRFVADFQLQDTDEASYHMLSCADGPHTHCMSPVGVGVC